MPRLFSTLLLTAVLGATGCTTTTCLCTCVPNGGGQNTPANGTACGIGPQDDEAKNAAQLLHCPNGMLKNCNCTSEFTIFCTDGDRTDGDLKPVPDKTVPKTSRRS